MKILHIGAHADGTGVAIAIRRLHKGLLDLGHDSSVLADLIWDRNGDPRIGSLYRRGPLWQRGRRRARHLLISLSHRGYRFTHARRTVGFHDDRSRYGREIFGVLPRCDVITVHAMLGWLDYRAFFAAAPRQAVVVPVLHDMAFFTGGCHHTGDCRRFTETCGACPVLGSQRDKDLSRSIWLRKRAAYASVPAGRVHFVAPSRWVAEEARRSSLLRGFPISVIPNAVDTTLFAPQDRRMSRDLLGIPHDVDVVLFMGEVFRVIKGFALLAEAVGRISRPRLMLVSAGPGMLPAEVKIPHLHLGYVTDERMLPVIYSAADVFVIPSMQDNSPQTVLEASACGVPVVGFATGGIVDLIRPGENGMLVTTGDVEGLASAISAVLANRSMREEMASRARQLALREFAVGIHARRYAALFDALVRGASVGQAATVPTGSLASP